MSQWAANAAHCVLRPSASIRPCGGLLPQGEGIQSPSPCGRGVGVRVRSEAALHGRSIRLRSYPHPPLRGTFSQGEKESKTFSLWEIGWGEGAGPSRAARHVHERLRAHPHPPLRGTFSRGEKGSKPLSLRERGWGEGAGRSRAARHVHSVASGRKTRFNLTSHYRTYGSSCSCCSSACANAGNGHAMRCSGAQTSSASSCCSGGCARSSGARVRS